MSVTVVTVPARERPAGAVRRGSGTAISWDCAGFVPEQVAQIIRLA